MGLDDKILQNQGVRDDESSGDETSDDRLAALKESQNNPNATPALASNQEDSNQNLSSADKVGALAAVQQEAKKKGAISRAKQAVGEKVSAIALTLAGLLRMSWGNLIQSFGLTLIWINIHAFGNLVFGKKIFCDLGQEWQMQVGNSKLMAAGAKAEADGASQVKKSAGKFAGLLEKMGMGCLDLTCCLSVIIILAIFALLLEIVTHPFGTAWEVIKGGIGWVWDRVTGAFSSRSE